MITDLLQDSESCQRRPSLVQGCSDGARLQKGLSNMSMWHVHASDAKGRLGDCDTWEAGSVLSADTNETL